MKITPSSVAYPTYYELAPTLNLANIPAATWTDFDCSSVVPVNALEIDIIVINAEGSTRTLGVRADGSSANRSLDIAWPGEAVFRVPAGTTRTVECYSSFQSGAIDFYCIGYTK